MKKHGFTLSEVIVALGIAGVTAALVVPVLSNLVPDKNKTKILNYHTNLENAIEDILSDETLYHPYTRFNPVTGNTFISCTGLECVGNCDLEIQKRVGVNGPMGPDNSMWVFEDDNNGGYIITINLEPSKNAIVYSSTTKIKDVNAYKFTIDKFGSIAPGDALTEAYIKNPFNVNDKKADEKVAMGLVSKYKQ